MTHITLQSICLSLISAGVLSAQVAGPLKWDAADAAVVRVKPSAFPDLPAAVRQYLERRGCAIPQSFSPGPHNVIRGRFTNSVETDVAVLCSESRVSTVLVFRGGSADDVAELAKTPDKNYLQDMGGRTIAYSRKLDAITPSGIRSLATAYGGPKLPPLDHEGINDQFLDKASVVWYWYGSRWLALQGAD